jgi:hypothetical protein
MLLSLIKRLYHWLPLSQGMRYRLGQYKNKYLRYTRDNPIASALDFATKTQIISLPQQEEIPPKAVDRWRQPATPGKRDYVFFDQMVVHLRRASTERALS